MSLASSGVIAIWICGFRFVGLFGPIGPMRSVASLILKLSSHSPNVMSDDLMLSPFFVTFAITSAFLIRFCASLARLEPPG